MLDGLEIFFDLLTFAYCLIMFLEQVCMCGFVSRATDQRCAKIRNRFAIDDRVTKAWFINPVNKWTITSTAAQSRLLLSDRLILFAVISLNDGNGKILRRRLMAFSSSQDVPGSLVPLQVDDGAAATASRRSLLQQQQPRELATVSEQQVSSVLQQLSQSPRTGVMPPIDFEVNIPHTLASVYGVEDRYYELVYISAVGRFSSGEQQVQVNDEFMRRLMANQAVVCPECSGIYPAFSNMRLDTTRSSGTAARRRNLLQLVSGAYYIPQCHQIHTNMIEQVDLLHLQKYVLSHLRYLLDV